MNAVVIESLRKQFGAQLVLPSFDLQIAEGEFVVLLGPSGCGKTTVLRCLAGLERPDGGRISIGGDVVEDAGRRLSMPIQKRDLGFVFQHYALWPHMTVHENIAYPLKMKGVGRSERSRKIDEVLVLAGLEGLENRHPGELSGGQQQRVALARALVASPRVLLLDEPLSNLDAQRRVSLRRQLRAIHREIRTTTVYVTHDQMEALTMADRVIVMNQGRIEQSGTPREVFERPATRFVAEFLGYENILTARLLRSNGRIATVEVDGLGELQVETALRGVPGQLVPLAFRASSIVLQDTENRTQNGFLATVRDRTYLGDFCEYELEVGGTRLLARQPAQAAAAPMPGTQHRIGVAPSSIVLLQDATDTIVSFPAVPLPTRLSA